MVLVFALIIAGTALAGSTVMLTRSTVEQRASVMSLSRARAFHLSESGIDLAINALRTNPNYTGVSSADLGGDAGRYSVEVIPDGASRRTIRSTGFSPLSSSRGSVEATSTIETVVQLTRGAGPGYGVLGVRSVRLDGWNHDEGTRDDRHTLRVDSYDSRQGPYTRPDHRAHLRVCTNGHEDRALALIGGVAMTGDVVLGPGSDPQTTLWRVPEQWTSISGSVSVAEVGAPVEPVEMPLLPDGGRLSISGHDVVTLPGGLYRFREVRISGDGRLVFTGAAEVYVEEGVHIAGKGGIDTASQLPMNLVLYVKGSHVSMNGEADLFAKINAPYATVELSGKGDVYGAVVGHDIVVTGRGDLHYDAALNLYDEALNPPRKDDPLQVSVLSWREVSPSPPLTP